MTPIVRKVETVADTAGEEQHDEQPEEHREVLLRRRRAVGLLHDVADATEAATITR